VPKKSAENEKKRVDTNRYCHMMILYNDLRKIPWPRFFSLSFFMFYFQNLFVFLTLVNQISLVLAVRYSIFSAFELLSLFGFTFFPKIKSFSWSNCSKYIFLCVYFSVRNS